MENLLFLGVPILKHIRVSCSIGDILYFIWFILEYFILLIVASTKVKVTSLIVLVMGVLDCG